MSEKLEWLFKLNDELSGSSRKMATALKSVEDEISKVDKGLKELERTSRKKALDKATDPMKRRRLELAIERDKLVQTKEATKSAAAETDKLSSAMGLSALKGTIWGAVISKGIDLALGLATSVARAVMGLAELGAGFAQAGLEASSFRRQMRLGFEISAGGKAGGNRELRDALFYSEKMSVGGEDMQKRFLSLLQGGFKGEEVPVLIQAIGDMAAAGQGEKADNIVLAIKQIRAKGRLQAEELVSQLADAGLNIGTVYEKIGKLIGKDSKGAIKAISKGEVGSELGIYAIVDTIRETFSKDGLIGNTAKSMADDSQALLGMLNDRPRRLMEELEGNKGIKTFEGFLQNLLKATDPDGPTGKRIVGRLNDIFDRAGKALFGDASTEDGFKKVEHFLDTAVGIVDRLVASARVFYGFMTGLVEGMGLGKLLEDAGNLFDGPMDENKIQALSLAFQDLGFKLGRVVEPMVRLVDLATQLADKFTFFESGKSNLLTGLLADSMGFGGVYRTAMNAAGQVTNGQMVTAGLRGFLPPQTSAAPSNYVELGGIHVSMGPGADAEAVAAKLREVVPSVIADALERMAIEQGAM